MSNTLPSYFRPVFWSYEISRLRIDRDKRRIVIDTINYGGWRHWKWLFETYGKEVVGGIVQAAPATEFRPRALRLASLILAIKKSKYASRSAYARR